MESFERDVSIWTRSYIEDAEKRPESPFAESGFALKRIIESGISLEDIGKLARIVAFESSFQTVHIIDEGYVSEDLPFWQLIETNSEGKPTGRSIRGLHEDLLNE